MRAMVPIAIGTGNRRGTVVMNTGGIAGADVSAVTIGTGHDKRPGREAKAANN